MELLHFRSVEVGFIEPLHPFSNFGTSEVRIFTPEKCSLFDIESEKMCRNLNRGGRLKNAFQLWKF